MAKLNLDPERHPSAVSNEISRLVAQGRRDESLSLYSAYLLMKESVRINRLSYLQPAWNGSVSISDITRILMLRLTAFAFRDTTGSEQTQEWLLEDFPNLAELRNHYLIDQGTELLKASPSNDFLEELSQTRKDYESLDYDDGPFHCEEFPYETVSPEDHLLGLISEVFTSKIVDAETESVLVDIGVSDWG